MSEFKSESDKNAALLNKAILFAVDKHAGQVRKGTDLPYIVHPLEVMTILGAMHVDTEVMAAGVLHDTVEDTGATVDDIKASFGDRVAELVQGHTEDKSKSWEERKKEALDELRDAPFDLKCLVIADKLSNMRAIARDYRQIGDKVWERFSRPKDKQAWYYAEGVKALESMQDNENTAEFYEEFKELYEEVFGNFNNDEDAEKN